MNERTHFFIETYLSHFILERFDVGCVWEVSWIRGQTAAYWPQVLLTIAALLSQSAWAAQPWVTESPSPLSGAGSHSAGILSPTVFNSNWNCPKPSVVPGYIIVSHLLQLIYTGASLDWGLGRGLICNIYIYIYIYIYYALADKNLRNRWKRSITWSNWTKSKCLPNIKKDWNPLCRLWDYTVRT